MISRRTGGLAVVAGALLLAGSCATGPGVRPDAAGSTTAAPAVTTTAGSTTTTGPAPGTTTVVIGVGDGGAPRTLNPFLDSPDAPVLEMIGDAVFARGWVPDPVSGDPMPVVLDALPSPAAGTVTDNGDGTISVSVAVRPEATWADGEAITADDLAFTIITASRPDAGIRGDIADLYDQIVPGSVSADGLRLDLRMEAGVGYQRLFSTIIPRHDIVGTDFATDWDDRMWTAGGPFSFVEYIPGQSLVLERNEAYWGADVDGTALPGLDRLIFRFYDNTAGVDPRLVDAFAAGDVDVVTISDAGESAGDFADVPGASMATGPGNVLEQVNFQFGPGNRNDLSQNRYLTYRRAVAHAIDREALATASGTTAMASVLAPFGVAGSGDAWDRYRPDLDEVQSLLFDLEGQIDLDPFAGDGLDLVLTIPRDAPSTVALAGRVVVALRDAGFDAQLQLEDSSVFFGQTLDNGSWDVAEWGMVAPRGLSGAVALIEAFDPDGLPFVGTNYFRWGTIDSTVQGDAVEEYRGIIDDLETAFEPTRVTELLLSAEEILADQAVLIPLVVRDEFGAVWQTGAVSGVAFNPFGSIAWNVGEWSVPGG